MKLLIGCINFNTKPFTEKWLDTLNVSLFSFSGEEAIDVGVVVVNNSPEEDLSDLKLKYPWVKFIEPGKNVGVSAGWNLIIKTGVDINGNFLYDYYLPANNDIYFTQKWATNFAKGLREDKNKEFGWISSFLNDYKEPDLTGVIETVQAEGRYWGGLRPEADDVDSIGMIDSVTKATYAPFGGIEKFADNLEIKYGIKLKEMHPKAPLFALSKECLKEVGLFDEYNSPNGLHEDADYCLRIRLSRFKIGCVYGAYSHHYSMMSRTKGEFKKEWWVESREKAFKEKWGVSSKETHLVTKENTKFRLDLGSGYGPKNEANKHWYHVEIDPKFSDIEFISDISKKLPFDDESMKEIYASNCLEHVCYKDVPYVLFDWSRILAKDGKIHIRVPNFRWVMEQYVSGRWQMSFEEGSELNAMHIVYGGDNPGEAHLHKAGFEFKTLSELLGRCGIINIRNVSEDGSWELRVEGIKQ